MNNSTAVEELTFSEVASNGSVTWIATKIVAVCLLILATLTGNVLVILAIYKTPSLRSSATNMFVASLAAADLLVGCLLMPAAASRDIGHEWHFGHLGCSLFTSFDILGCTASIMNLCVVSYDRFLAISRPLKYMNLMTKKLVVLLLVLAWSTALLISFVPVLMKWHLRDPSDLPLDCELNLNTAYAIISSLVSFYMPAIVILATNFRVFSIAREQHQQIKKLVVSTPKKSRNSYNGINNNNIDNNEKSDLNITENGNFLASAIDGGDASREVSSAGSRAISILSKLKLSRPQIKGEQKATVTIGIIIGTFLLCWTPFFVCNVLFHFCCFNLQVFTVFTWVGYVNSACNPIILYCFNREYKKAFLHVLGIQRRNSGTALHFNLNS